jgi:hypothetical protein
VYKRIWRHEFGVNFNTLFSLVNSFNKVSFQPARPLTVQPPRAGWPSRWRR